MKEPYFLQRTGEKLILEWAASDDGGIVAQKVLFTPHGSNPDFSVIATLPPTQRRYELTIPVIPPSSNLAPPFVRILAVDTAGQEGFDEVSFAVPYTEDWTGTLTITSDFSGGFRPGERVDVCWTKANGASGTIEADLFLDGDDASIPLGGAHTGVNCLSGGMVVPYVSTDSLASSYADPGRFASIALVSVEVHPGDCGPMSVVAFHGTADRTVRTAWAPILA